MGTDARRTFSDGPTSGQFTTPNPYGNFLPPYPNKQPVQGISAVLQGADDDSFVVMTDNGFGTKANSADAVLRLYSLKPDFKTARGGAGTVTATNYLTGTALKNFTQPSRITLNDTNQKLSIPIQADLNNYYGDVSKPAVDASLKFSRLLTGADLDVESVREDKQCNLWFGDEFGPYLIKTDLSGTVLRKEIPLPGVFAPENKDVLAGTAVANLPSSGGFEGMAINERGDRLYALLEKTVTGDMTAVGDDRFLVIERNGATATEGGKPFKKIFLIDIRGIANGGTVKKTELVDLMNINDPDDLNGDGSTTFTFPYVTIESVLPLDARTLLVINDNNFPGGGGRELGSDATEFLKIRLAQPINNLKPRYHGHFGDYAPGAARIRDLNISSGENVAAGTSLITLDTPDLDQRRKRAAEHLRQLQWQLEVSSFDTEQRANQIITREELAGARAELASAPKELSRFDMRAPFAGVLVNVSPKLRQGVWVNARERLGTLIDPHSWQVETYLTDSEIQRVYGGDSARFYPENSGVESLSLRVIRIYLDATCQLPEEMLPQQHGGDKSSRVNATAI